jgi:hypothetical protein
LARQTVSRRLDYQTSRARGLLRQKKRVKNSRKPKNMKSHFSRALVALSFIFLAAWSAANARTPINGGQNAAPSISDVLSADGAVKPNAAGSFSTQGFEMKLAADGSPRFVQSGGGDNKSEFTPQASCGDGWDERFFTNGASGGNTVEATVSDGAGNIYIGGSFTSVGNVAANRIARWNGTSWSALGSGISVNGTVYALAVAGTDVYAGGDFNTAGGVPVTNIARWNGTSWSALDSGMNSGGSGIVRALAAVGTDIYAGGQFTTAGGASANRIARWNGTSWSALGSGVNGTVRALAVVGTDVYAGGGFTMAGGISVTNIARWNGASWSALGSGISGGDTGDGTVRALAVVGTDVYAGGSFGMAGGASVNKIARWDGASWSALGSGIGSGTVYALAVSGTDVYAGGFFNTAGGVSAKNIARWNGTSWSALGSGINSGGSGIVYALAVAGTDVYAGGNFNTAGCRPSSHFARYFNQSFAGGGANNDWFTAANWSNGAVPAVTSDAIIANADVAVSTADATIRDLRVDEGGTVTIAAGRTLTVTRNLNLLGSITGAGTIVITNCDPAALTRDAGAGGYIRSTLVRCVNSGGTFDFPVGTANGYSPVQMTDVAGTGNVSILANEGAYSGVAAGLSSNRLGRWWQIENSGGGIANANLRFNYLQTDIAGTEASYTAYRIAGGTAMQVSGSVDTTANTVSANNVTQFSDWTLAQASPTAAGVSVGGRIFAGKGRGLANATVYLTDSQGNTRLTRTNSFGYYRFDDVAAGQTVIVSVASKRYQFEPRVFNVTETFDELNFAPLP